MFNKATRKQSEIFCGACMLFLSVVYAHTSEKTVQLPLLENTGRFAKVLHEKNSGYSPTEEIYGCKVQKPEMPVRYPNPQTRDTCYWNCKAPEEVGMDSQMLLRMVQSMQTNRSAVTSCMIVRNTNCVLEAYAHPLNDTMLNNIKSVSKSLLSALVGIALREKFLTSIDQTLDDFFPEYLKTDPDPRKKMITLRHLLTMTAGFNIEDESPEYNEIFSIYNTNWIKSIVEKPLQTAPGTFFCYSTCLTHLMSAIVTKATGMSLLEFARIYLFEPLGIKRYEWLKDPQGYYFGGAELKLTTRDMAKFGYLYLNNGLWENTQIVPKEWIDESTKNQVFGVSNAPAYGFWWWVINPATHEFSAYGWGGQLITIQQNLNTLVVMTSINQTNLPDIYCIHYIDPSIVSFNSPLPANERMVCKLNNAVYALKHPLPKPSCVPLPATVSLLGKKFESSDSFFKEISFAYTTPHTLQMRYTTRFGYSDTNIISMNSVSTLSPAWDLLGYSMSGFSNEVACNGTWINETTLQISYQSIGSPVSYQIRITFYKNWISGTFDVPFVHTLIPFYAAH